MNPPKCNDEDYINFIIATPKQLTATKAARVQPERKSQKKLLKPKGKATCFKNKNTPSPC